MEDHEKFIIVQHRENHKLYFAGFSRHGRFKFPNQREEAKELHPETAKSLMNAFTNRARNNGNGYSIEPANEDPEKRLQKVIEGAKMKFWGHVAESFPEIETGDLEPLVLNRFDTVIEETVKNWYERNNKRY